MNLREKTVELHHLAERHPLSTAMLHATVTPQQWADWLGALFLIHYAMDDFLPDSMARAYQIAEDLAELKVQPRFNHSAMRFIKKMTTYERASGAGYVFNGSHLMGGIMIARNNKHRLPVKHLEFETWLHRQQAMNDWAPFREKTELEEQVYSAFQAAISIMDEIMSYE